MACSNAIVEYSGNKTSKELTVKIICIGDSAVGKSKLMERFLFNDYKPQVLSTNAVTLFRHLTEVDNENVIVEFWDTAGQEIYQSMHPSYYYQAHGCIMIFDATRKMTYRHIWDWYEELRSHRRFIPVFCAANKIDANMEITQKSLQFPQKNNIPLYYVSASDGTNVVKLFQDVIQAAVKYKKNPIDIEDQIMEELQKIDLNL